MRAVSREDPDVMLALGRARYTEAAEDWKRRRAIADANNAVMTREKVRTQIREAESLLKKRKQQVADEEQVIEARHAVKQFR